MDLALPLDKMTPTEKLSVMERLWDDLCRNPDDVLSPPWHGEVLAAREQRLRDGQSAFHELSEVRDRIRKTAP